jgi:hypothetical protein
MIFFVYIKLRDVRRTLQLSAKPSQLAVQFLKETLWNRSIR